MEKFDAEKIKSLERKVTQLSILYSIASSIGVTPDENRILELVIDGIMDNLTPEIAIIYLLDREKNELYPYLSRGVKIEEISKERIKSGEFISGLCFEKGEPIEIGIDKEKDYLEPFLRRYPIKKVVCHPIKSYNRILGVIHISKFSSFTFTEEERWILTILANRAGVAMESANLYKELELWGKSLEKKVEERTREIQEHLERIKALEKTTLRISSEMNLSKSLPFIGRESAKILNADKWAIFVVSKKRPGHVEKYFSSGLSEDYLKDLLENWKKVEGAKVVYSQKPLFIEDILEVENPFAIELALKGGYRSLNIIPCNFRGTLVGIIVYYHTNPKTYSDKEKEIAIAFGELIALAISNSNLFQKKKKAIKQLKAVNKLGRFIATPLNLQKIYNEAVELIQKIQNYPFVFILTYESISNKLVQVASGGWLKEKAPRKYSQSPDRGIIGRIFKTGKIYLAKDVRKDPYYLPYFEEVKSELAVPIKDKKGNVIGVIDVQSENLDAFEKEDIETISTLADQLSIMIENIVLYKDLTNRIKELSTLYNLSKELSCLLDLEKVLNRIIINLKAILPFTSGGILIYNPSLKALEVKAYLGPKLDEFKGIVEIGKGITGNCFLQKKPIIVPDVRKDERYLPGAPNILSEVAVPLIYQNEVIGVLNLESSKLNEYNEEHLRILNYVASHVASAIRNTLLFEEVKRKAEEMRILNEISSATISVLDLRKLYRIISKKLMEMFNVDTYYLAICDHKKDIISFPIFIDRGKLLRLKPIKISQASGLTGWIIQNKRPLMFTDYEKEKGSLPVKAIIIIKETQSYIGVPIILKEKVLGVISIQSYKKKAFTSGHLELLQTIANNIALSL